MGAARGTNESGRRAGSWRNAGIGRRTGSWRHVIIASNKIKLAFLSMSAPTSHSVADLSRGRVNGPYFLVVSLLTIYSASGITTHKRDGWKKIVVRIVSDGRAKVLSTEIRRNRDGCPGLAEPEVLYRLVV
jgi:hypothetical protein